MIHHVFIIDARNVIVVSWRYEAIDIEIDSSDIMEFAARVKGSYVPILEEIGTVKYAGGPIRQGVVVLCSETLDDDTTLELKVREVTAEFEKVLDSKVDFEEFVEKLRDYITIPLKISLLGYGGVGKTTFATLLSGGTPPIKYEPTVTFGLFKLKGIRFGTYQVVIWDLAGQEIFHKLWSLYLRDSRVVFLITDSTVGNVLESKELVDFIRRERLDVKMRAIANKQDLVGAMSPKLVERILGIKAEGMVAIDVRNRQKVIDLIRKSLEDLDEDEDTDYEVDFE